jgi:hypothetical protein
VRELLTWNIDPTSTEASTYLPTDTWVKAIIAAHSAATTVIDIAENLESYRAQADGWLADVAAVLGKRHGDLDAFELVLKRVNAQLFQES